MYKIHSEVILSMFFVSFNRIGKKYFRFFLSALPQNKETELQNHAKKIFIRQIHVFHYVLQYFQFVQNACPENKRRIIKQKRCWIPD